MHRARPILACSILALAAAALGWPDAAVEQVLRQYVDRPGFSWVTKRTAHFQLYFETNSDASRYIGALKRNVEEDRARVLRLLGARDYDPKIYAFLLTNGAQMKELVGVEVDGRSRPVQHAVFSVVNPDRLHLTHEICHEIASNLWGAAEPWIEEGLAVYADEGSPNIYYDSWALLNSRKLIPLEKLVDPEWKSSTFSPDVTYTELGGFIKYLHDRFGVEGVRQLWKAGSKGIPIILGEPLSDLEAEWHESLVRQFPERPTRHFVYGETGFWQE